MEAATKVVLYIIPIVVLVLLVFFYFGPSGALDKLKKVSGGLENYVPAIGTKELTAGKIDVGATQRSEFGELESVVKSMVTSPHGPCFAYYKKGGFSNFESGSSITFSYDAAHDGTNVVVNGGPGGKQVVSDLSMTISKMKPCVVAGSAGIVRAFEEGYLNDKAWSDKVIHPMHFKPVTQLKIEYFEGKTVLCKNANHIVVSELGIGVATNECDNLNDYGVLYTPDGVHVCFFPTVYTGSSDKDGLNDDYLGSNPTNSISIPQQMMDGKLKMCEVSVPEPPSFPTS